MKLVIMIGIFLGLSQVQAQTNILNGDATNGQKISKMCAQCHGEDGRTQHGMHPNLAGQNSRYLVYQLNEFKNDRRIGHHMNDIAKTLSEQDILDVSLYYSQLNSCGAVNY